jgi:hypothetical protein
LGKGIDRTATWTIGLARKETSPTGLGKALACKVQEARAYCTARDRSRELTSSS